MDDASISGVTTTGISIRVVFTSRLMRNGGRLYDTCAHASVDTCAYLKQRFSKRVQIGYTCSINVAFDKKASLNRGFRCPFFEDMLDCVSIFSSSFVIIFLLFLGRGGKMFETLNLRKRDGLIVDWKILRKSVVTRFLRFFGGRKAGGIYHWP